MNNAHVVHVSRPLQALLVSDQLNGAILGFGINLQNVLQARIHNDHRHHEECKAVANDSVHQLSLVSQINLVSPSRWKLQCRNNYMNACSYSTVLTRPRQQIHQLYAFYIHPLRDSNICSQPGSHSRRARAAERHRRSRSNPNTMSQ